VWFLRRRAGDRRTDQGHAERSTEQRSAATKCGRRIEKGKKRRRAALSCVCQVLRQRTPPSHERQARDAGTRRALHRAAGSGGRRPATRRSHALCHARYSRTVRRRCAGGIAMRIVADYFRELGRGTIAGWNRFWFTPSDPATLGLIRILAGSMLFYTHLIWSLDLESFFGTPGWLSPNALK